MAIAKKEMQALFPGAPFEYEFLEATYDLQYQDIQQFESLSKYFASLAIIIACLGLFALSYYSTQRRTKEVAVRKIFGARIFNLLFFLSKSYLKITVVSGLLGSFLTFYLMNAWLQNFAFAIDLDVTDFLIPLTAVTIIAAVTVSYNCLKISLTNPSHSLRDN
jgi:putative ABC transport system permease protein